MSLTETQLAFYDFIWEFVETERRWPKFEEIRTKFGWKSNNSVARKYNKLVDQGFMIKDNEGYHFTSKRPGLEANVKPNPKEA